jgi:hypothetical protein
VAPITDTGLFVANRANVGTESVYKKWRSLHDENLSSRSLTGLLNNDIPAIRVPQFLSSEECNRMVDVVSSHKIVRKSL